MAYEVVRVFLRAARHAGGQKFESSTAQCHFPVATAEKCSKGGSPVGSDVEAEIHFGRNCSHLRREKHKPADCRCTVLIEEYGGKAFDFLEYRAWVPFEEAALLLSVSEAELVTTLREGKREFAYSTEAPTPNFVPTSTGFHGEEYLDKKIYVAMQVRWASERCQLIETGGICYHFKCHGGRQIKYAMEAFEPRGT